MFLERKEKRWEVVCVVERKHTYFTFTKVSFTPPWKYGGGLTKRHIEIVKDDEVAIEAIPLATKPLMIVEYKIDKDGRMGYFKLIRVDGSSKRYSSMIKMLQDIDRE
ncbi:hypothetical protein Tco_0057459 [Tanacetum coccineum]